MLLKFHKNHTGLSFGIIAFIIVLAAVLLWVFGGLSEALKTQLIGI